jgi:hypothetical protein
VPEAFDRSARRGSGEDPQSVERSLPFLGGEAGGDDDFDF